MSRRSGHRMTCLSDDMTQDTKDQLYSSLPVLSASGARFPPYLLSFTCHSDSVPRKSGGKGGQETKSHRAFGSWSDGSEDEERGSSSSDIVSHEIRMLAPFPWTGTPFSP